MDDAQRCPALRHHAGQELRRRRVTIPYDGVSVQ